ncbi:hypothetical protein [Gulosibacter sp. 10]|uniref:hypothetical protein n=1 Tax=Gulosibacter sp. 10 TaxID=1255570 RepID=UPI00097EB4C7|nr:hypothetical protein [Gulosibacter sp. 10]SJM66485.1 hypothetical protein FM112_11810 [Gulosibacter sp. 10]
MTQQHPAETETECTDGGWSRLLASRVEDFARLNPIAAGRVSPHRTFDGEHYRIRNLALGEGAVLARHVAPAPLIVTVLEGRVEFALPEIAHELAAGAVLCVDADVPHEVTALEPSRLLLTLVVSTA